MISPCKPSCQRCSSEPLPAKEKGLFFRRGGMQLFLPVQCKLESYYSLTPAQGTPRSALCFIFGRPRPTLRCFLAGPGQRPQAPGIHTGTYTGRCTHTPMHTEVCLGNKHDAVAGRGAFHIIQRVQCTSSVSVSSVLCRHRRSFLLYCPPWALVWVV